MPRLFLPGSRALVAAVLAGLLGCTASLGSSSGGASGSGSGGSTGSGGGRPGSGGSGMTGSGGGSATGGSGVTGSGGGSGGSTSSGGSGPEATAPVVVPRVARLSHFQWSNAVQDLLQLDGALDSAASFPPDAPLGFDNNASQLRVSTALHDAYQGAAEALAMQVASSPTALAKLVPAGAPTEATARAKAFIQSFGQKAYRRPLTSAEVDQHLTLFQKGAQMTPELDAFAAGALITIQMVLQSPLFIYRAELSQQAVGGRIQLSGHELAARLAFAVTGSIPDDTLLQAAAAGSLDSGDAKAALDTQAQRLLETPRAKASALHLHTQALALSRYATIQRDKANYPEYSDTTPASLRRSAELFLDSIFSENLGVKAILTSPNAFVDSNIAKLYGLSGTFGTDFMKVDVSAKSRRGFLTQPGFLALFAGEHQPDPIHRGVFINEQILCTPVGVPTANLPPVPVAQPGQTNRKVIDSLTGVGTCGQSCHATKINPVGFAFENYDPLGRYRTQDNGIDVDASGSYELDGTTRSFQNALDLTQLLSESQAAHRCYASQWMAYLYGRPVSSNDAAVLDDLASRSKGQNISTKDVIRGLVRTESFLTRSAGE